MNIFVNYFDADDRKRSGVLALKGVGCGWKPEFALKFLSLSTGNLDVWFVSSSILNIYIMYAVPETEFGGLKKSLMS